MSRRKTLSRLLHAHTVHGSIIIRANRLWWITLGCSLARRVRLSERVCPLQRRSAAVRDAITSYLRLPNGFLQRVPKGIISPKKPEAFDLSQTLQIGCSNSLSVVELRPCAACALTNGSRRSRNGRLSGTHIRGVVDLGKCIQRDETARSYPCRWEQQSYPFILVGNTAHA